MKTISLIIFLLIPTIVHADETCNYLHKQMSMLSEQEKETLNNEGFVLGMQINHELPGIVISEAVERSCKDRLIAEKYFENKLSGESKFKISEDEFCNARKSISHAACEALKVNRPWVDGASHEIYNIVSDDLLPYWSSCISEHIKNSKSSIDIEYFTPKIIESPPQILLKVIREKKNDKTINTYGMALLLFIEKNITGEVQRKIAKDYLDSAIPLNDLQISNKKIKKEALSLIIRKEKISLDDINHFGDKIYGEGY